MPQKKLYTLSQALEYAKAYCAKSEHCQSEVIEKLRSYSVCSEDIEQCLAELISSGFINEQRYADLFARSKFHQNKWGKIKISQHLKAKDISDYCIKKALDAIDGEEYMQTLLSLAEKKLSEIDCSNRLVARRKLTAFLYGRGFEFDCINRALDSLEDAL